MALVLSERDYKLVTLTSKIAGIFVWAAGSVNIFTFGRVGLGLFLILLGTVVALAPVPMSVLRPDSYDEAEREDLLHINE